MRSFHTRQVSRWGVQAIVLLIAVAGPLRTEAQRAAPPPTPTSSSTERPNTAFTIDDALDMVSYTVADVTKDGKWIAATAASRRDGLGTDYFRDSDPTYVRTNRMRAVVIDVATGAERAIFADKRTVKSLQWSPDGSRVAMLMLRGDVFEPVIWERATGRLTTVRIPGGRYVAENSDVRWTADGAALLFSLRTIQWRERARAQFSRSTRGPVFVQSSTDPFLAWDEIRRLSAIRSIASYDLKTGKVAELVPEQRLTGYTLSEDGTTLTFTEDLVEKTQYEAAQGAANKVWVKRLPAGEPTVLYATTRGMNLTWAPMGSDTRTVATDGSSWRRSMTRPVSRSPGRPGRNVGKGRQRIRRARRATAWPASASARRGSARRGTF